MPGDLLDNLKNRGHRVLVPERRDPLIPFEVADEAVANLPSNSTGAVQKPTANRNRLGTPPMTNYPGELRRLTVRIDEEIGFKLDEICSRQKLTPETLVEALLEQCEARPELMSSVIEEAKRRYKLRKGAGVKKRAIAMQKYG